MNSIPLSILPSVKYSMYDTWAVDGILEKYNIDLCLTACCSQCMHWGLE